MSKARANYLKRNYGLTLAEYDRMLTKQKGVCAICLKSPKTNYLSVDHDHKSGILRGLLDWKCNKALQMFSDNPILLLNAFKYLKNPPATKALNEPRYTAPGRVGTKRRTKLLKQQCGIIN